MQTQDQQHQAPNGDSNYVKADAIAQFYDTDVSTVFKWAKAGRIPSEKIEGIRRFHLPSVRQKLEGIYRISEEDFELGIF